MFFDMGMRATLDSEAVFVLSIFQNRAVFLFTLTANFRLVYTAVSCSEVHTRTKYSSQR